MSQKNCYIYTRVSTAVQIEGYSLEAQEERLREYAEYKELTVVGDYCDAGRSGKSIKGRPEFQRMMNDVMSQRDRVNYVLVYKLSRFGRNAADVLKSLQLLNDFGVDLVCVEDAIDSSTQGGRLTLSILSAVAEIERENIAVQFTAGRMQKLKEGEWPGGPAPYGYRKGSAGLLVTEPSESEIVKMIYRLYMQEGMAVNSVATWLNHNGYRRIVNGEDSSFTRDMVSSILGNPVYCGKIVYNRRSVGGTERKEILEIDGKQEAFVTQEQWNAVQKKRERIREKYRRTENLDRISLLGGLVRCPVCGAGMTYVKSHRVNPNHGGYYKTIYGYVCRFHVGGNLGRKCSFHRQYNQEELDSAVFEIISNLTLTEVFRKEVAAQMGTQEDSEALEKKIGDARKRLRTMEREKEKLSDSLNDLDAFDDDYDARYDAIQERIDRAYDRIQKAEDDLKHLQNMLTALQQGIHGGEKIEKMLSHLTDLYPHMSCAERREMYRLLIERIEVYPEHPEGRVIRSISFRIPVFYEAGDEETSFYMERTPDNRVIFTLDCSATGITKAEAKATYAQIKAYIREKHGTCVSNLYIAQIKRKYGMDLRPNYNISKKPNARVVQCPPAKEAMIVEALQHFRMLEPGAKPAGEEGTDEA